VSRKAGKFPPPPPADARCLLHVVGDGDGDCGRDSFHLTQALRFWGAVLRGSIAEQGLVERSTSGSTARVAGDHSAAAVRRKFVGGLVEVSFNSSQKKRRTEGAA